MIIIMLLVHRDIWMMHHLLKRHGHVLAIEVPVVVVVIVPVVVVVIVVVIVAVKPLVRVWVLVVSLYPLLGLFRFSRLLFWFEEDADVL